MVYMVLQTDELMPDKGSQLKTPNKRYIQYFPFYIFGHFTYRWYSGHLLSLKEPSRTKDLNKSQLSQVYEKFKSEQFFKAPAELDKYGFDGTQWLVEALWNGECYVVSRWSPDDNDPITDFGKFIQKLAKSKN